MQDVTNSVNLPFFYCMWYIFSSLALYNIPVFHNILLVKMTGMFFESTGRNTRHHVALCYLERKVYHSANMGGALSNFFQSGSALLSAGNHRGVSEHTRSKVRIIFDALRANPRVTVQRLEGLLSQIPKVSHVRSFVQSFVRNFVILLFFLKLRKIMLKDHRVVCTSVTGIFLFLMCYISSHFPPLKSKV